MTLKRTLIIFNYFSVQFPYLVRFDKETCKKLIETRWERNAKDSCDYPSNNFGDRAQVCDSRFSDVKEFPANSEYQAMKNMTETFVRDKKELGFRQGSSLIKNVKLN